MPSLCSLGSRLVEQVTGAVVGAVGLRVGQHLDDQLDAGEADLGQRVADQRLVAALDALLHVGAGHGDDEEPTVEVHGPSVLERREPDRLGDLGSEDLRRCVPQVLCVAHLRGCLLVDEHVHNPVHTCG